MTALKNRTQHNERKPMLDVIEKMLGRAKRARQGYGLPDRNIFQRLQGGISAPNRSTSGVFLEV